VTVATRQEMQHQGKVMASYVTLNK